MAKKTISISLWPILIFAWFVWGIFDDDEKDALKETAVEVVVEAKEILIEQKDGTLKKLEDMTNADIEETGIEVREDVHEPPEEKQAGPIGPLPDEEDEPEPEGRKL